MHLQTKVKKLTLTPYKMHLKSWNLPPMFLASSIKVHNMYTMYMYRNSMLQWLNWCQCQNKITRNCCIDCTLQINNMTYSTLHKYDRNNVCCVCHCCTGVDKEFSVVLESVLTGHEDWIYGVHWHPAIRKGEKILLYVVDPFTAWSPTSRLLINPHYFVHTYFSIRSQEYSS